MNSGFNHTSQCTSIMVINAECLRALDPIFAEILVHKVKEFLDSLKVETPLHNMQPIVMATERNVDLVDSEFQIHCMASKLLIAQNKHWKV